MDPVRRAHVAASAYCGAWAACIVVVVAVALGSAFFGGALDADDRADAFGALAVVALVVCGAVVVADGALAVCLERFARSRGHRDVPLALLALLAVVPVFTLYFGVRAARAAAPEARFPSGNVTIGAFLLTYVAGTAAMVTAMHLDSVGAGIALQWVSFPLVRLATGWRVRRALADLVDVDVDARAVDRAHGAAPVAG